MENFRTLYGYELKKILRRKIVWAAAVLILISTLTTAAAYILGNYVVNGKVVDSNYHQFLIDREYERALSGRAINQTLLNEIAEGYGKIPEDAELYTTTEEYQIYARPYSGVFQLISWMAEMTPSEMMAWEMDYQELYERHAASLESTWEISLLTEAEKEYWREKEAALPHPLTYECTEGYTQLLDMLYAFSIPLYFYMAVCLSGVFAEEHSRRTDQLILCSRYGKKRLCFAKILAGLSFAALSALLVSGILIAAALTIYGTDGFSAAVQLLVPDYSGHLTAGASVIIGYTVLTISCILTASIVMLLSELLRSSMLSLALVTAGLMSSGFIHIPDHYRVLGQIWDYLPFNFAAAWNILDVRLVSVFGKFFEGWQIVPPVYFLCCGILTVLGYFFYSRYQVKGR